MAVNVNSEANNFEEFQKIQKFKKYIKSEYDKYFKEWYIDFERINNSKLLILVEHYKKTLGAFHFGGRVMIIETESALKLINKYFQN